MTGDEPTQLYRHFDAQGRLLYVGISLSTVARLTQHRNSSDWYSQISRVEIQKFDTRAEAEGAEWEAIQKEKPIHNVIGNKPASRLARFKTAKRPFCYKPLWPICGCLLEGKPPEDEIILSCLASKSEKVRNKNLDEMESEGLENYDSDYWDEIEETLTDAQIIYGLVTKEGIFAKAFCDHCGGTYKVHETSAWTIQPIECSFDDDFGLLKKWPYLPNSVFFPKDILFQSFLKADGDSDGPYGKDDFYTWDEWRQLWLHGTIERLEVA